MILWRIASTTRNYAAGDLSGAGAAKFPGRWNDNGQHVVYAAPTLALAVLETAAHIEDSGLPMNRYVVEIDVPDDIWENRRLTLGVSGLPVGWDAIPSAHAALTVGSTWYASGTHALLEVPSVIVPEESVVLINASLAECAAIRAREIRRFDYNSLFRR